MRIQLNKSQNSDMYAIIDDKYEILSELSWQKQYDGYAQGRVSGHMMLMHRAIMTLEIGRELLPTEEIDHINGNRLDNRVENLRICTRAENNKNQKKRKDNKAGIKGIRERKGRWQARIQTEGKSICLGSFSNKEKAQEAYRQAAKAQHKDYANYGDE